MKISTLRSAVESLKKLDTPSSFVGIVHPLQYLWLKRHIHPWFDYPLPSFAKELQEQSEADYLLDGINGYDDGVDVDVRYPPKAVTPQRSTRGVLP